MFKYRRHKLSRMSVCTVGIHIILAIPINTTWHVKQKWSNTAAIESQQKQHVDVSVVVVDITRDAHTSVSETGFSKHFVAKCSLLSCPVLAPSTIDCSASVEKTFPILRLSQDWGRIYWSKVMTVILQTSTQRYCLAFCLNNYGYKVP